MKRILVILDYIPAGFDTEKVIGISCNNERCKFLLTARSKKEFPSVNSKEEICHRKSICMLPLSPEDAWRLLQEYSGIEDDDDESSSQLLTVAKEIAFKYEWISGAIVDLGYSLKGKRVKEWKGLLNSLRHSTARYQIFLSFRGIDTREHFTSTLYDELKKNGLKTFIDNELKHGDQISTELVKAVEDSRLSIVVLSENYPNSSWCLDELVHILECMKSKKQLVWPVFYKVEPTHIRHQTGPCAEAIAELEQRFEKDKIAKWKKALCDVCALTGRTYQTGCLICFQN